MVDTLLQSQPNRPLLCPGRTLSFVELPRALLARNSRLDPQQCFTASYYDGDLITSSEPSRRLFVTQSAPVFQSRSRHSESVTPDLPSHSASGYDQIVSVDASSFSAGRSLDLFISEIGTTLSSAKPWRTAESIRQHSTAYLRRRIS